MSFDAKWRGFWLDRASQGQMWPKRHLTSSWLMTTSPASWRLWCGDATSTTASRSSSSSSWPLTWWLWSLPLPEPVSHRFVPLCPHTGAHTKWAFTGTSAILYLQTRRSQRLETEQNDPEHPHNPHTDLKPLESSYHMYCKVLTAAHSTPASQPRQKHSCFL